MSSHTQSFLERGQLRGQGDGQVLLPFCKLPGELAYPGNAQPQSETGELATKPTNAQRAKITATEKYDALKNTS